MDSILDQVRKVKALADRGKDGERANAERKLAELLKKHGLTEADLESETRSRVMFRYLNDWERRLLLQLEYMITNGRGGPNFYPDARRRLLGFDLLPAEAADMKTAYAVLRRAVARELDLSFRAFILANHLYPPSPPEDDNSETPAEYEEIVKRSDLIDRINLRRALSEGAAT